MAATNLLNVLVFKDGGRQSFAQPLVDVGSLREVLQLCHPLGGEHGSMPDGGGVRGLCLPSLLLRPAQLLQVRAAEVNHVHVGPVHGLQGPGARVHADRSGAVYPSDGELRESRDRVG